MTSVTISVFFSQWTPQFWFSFPNGVFYPVYNLYCLLRFSFSTGECLFVTIFVVLFYMTILVILLVYYIISYYFTLVIFLFMNLNSYFQILSVLLHVYFHIIFLFPFSKSSGPSLSCVFFFLAVTFLKYFRICGFF